MSDPGSAPSSELRATDADDRADDRLAWAEEIADHLRRLPAEQREVLLQVYRDGLGWPDVAPALDLPPREVSAAGRRGLRGLACLVVTTGVE